MSKINCYICNGIICKYSKDFKSSGGLTVDIGQGKELWNIDVCHNCSKEITKEFVVEAK